ncbi:MAG: hypothetical protein K2K21_00635 [Lachnospiraceae bacterium]|nr:hypothetical protein [Lachnospiraceae bacterium]
MVREFSEEKRQEIFRLLDEIDNREWKSFMEWCGSSAEEFGDWPDKLAVSAYTMYVDEYHKKVLETNEMTRQQVNRVFENVAEIDTRYAGHMKECQAKVKEQIAMVRTMTEFMDSMSDGNPNMVLINKESVNESIRTEEKVNLTVTSSNNAENEINFYDLNDYINYEIELSEDEILQILEDALNSEDITQDECDYVNVLFTEMNNLKDEILVYEEERQNVYEKIINIYDLITERNRNKQYNNETNILFLNDFLYSGEDFDKDEILRILDEALDSGDITQDEYNNLIILLLEMHNYNQVLLMDEILIQSLYEELEIEYNRITRKIQNGTNETNIYFLHDYFDSGEEFSKDEILWILDGSLLSGDITRGEYKYLIALFTEMFDSTNEERIQTLYERIKNEYNRIVVRQQAKMTLCDPVVAYQGYPQVEDFDHMVHLVDNSYTCNNLYAGVSNCYDVDVSERVNISGRGWNSYMNRSLDQMMTYYINTAGFRCIRNENQLFVSTGNQVFTYQLLDDKWWVDENGRYLITVGPNVLKTDYDGGSLNFDKFSQYFGCRIDVILVNDAELDDVLTLECVYGGDIKAHTADFGNGVFMSGVSFLDPYDTATPDGSIVEFIGSPNLVDENDPKKGVDNGDMSRYHVDQIIVYDNTAGVN